MNKYSEVISDKLKKADLSNSDDLAYLTHFMQSSGSELAKYFEEKAIIADKKFREAGYESILSETVRDNGTLHLELDYDVPFPFPANEDFTFIDLFAGIGGFRLALQSFGGKCVFSSEIDKYCKRTYEANFGEVPFGDIKNFTGEEITDEQLNDLVPDHDVLTAGFPCQAFSIAGKRGGFEDTRGTLFFDVARILNVKRPKAFILENVKGLVSHKRGKTLSTILNVLRNDLNYFVPDPKVLNAKNFGVPQNRERILIVGFRQDTEIESFKYPETNIKDSQFSTGEIFAHIKEKEEVSVRYYLSETYLETLREHKRRHAEKGNGFGFEVIKDHESANAIVVGGMGRERNLVLDDRLTNFKPVTNIKGDVNREDVRRMTPREWARLQGFPDEFRLDVVSDTQNYKQFGNSVAIPVIQAVGKEVANKLLVEHAE